MGLMKERLNQTTYSIAINLFDDYILVYIRTNMHHFFQAYQNFNNPSIAQLDKRCNNDRVVTSDYTFLYSSTSIRENYFNQDQKK